jgi:C4-dicarboxylate-specific signal transduction histidine kinase
VLNSLNVSSTVIGTKARTSQVEKFGKLAALLHEHSGDLAGFLTQDPKGRLLPDYIAMLAKRALEERAWLVAEIASMQKNIDHIKEIVAMQQGYARVAGVTEMIEAETLFEDALQINSTALSGHDVKVIREYAPVPLLCVEKGKILQILINLIRNAMFACDEARKLSAGEKNLVVRVEPGAKGNTVKLIVRDNGVGIPQENMLRIFRHGFTTRANGHGFGLHASALAAKEMRGSLAAQSEGAGKGATFTLELPIAPVSALHVPDSPPDPHGVSDPMRHSRATGSRPAFAEHT